MSHQTPPLWFPFTRSEVEFGLGALGLGATLAAGFEVSGTRIIQCTGAAVLCTYLVGLLVYSRRQENRFELLEDGALAGNGYIPLIRTARKSLLLTHVDDDPPSEELLALYRRLLNQGVQLRRLLFVRRGGQPSALDWVETFGSHAGLEQRVVPPGEADVMRMSFVVIDEDSVALSIPGTDVSSGHDYGQGMVLRNLLVIRDLRVAGAFVEAHRQLWASASPLL